MSARPVNPALTGSVKVIDDLCTTVRQVREELKRQKRIVYFEACWNNPMQRPHIRERMTEFEEHYDAETELLCQPEE